MAVFFGLPDPDDVAKLDHAMKTWHPDLHNHAVRVQMVFASSDGNGPAVRHRGNAALATIRVIPLKDRLTKGYDAECVVDRAAWNLGADAHHLALLDHELSHLELVRKKVKQPKGYKGDPVYVVARDDLGRPKLKLRKGDWDAGDGFAAVVGRHGDYASEFADLRRCHAFAVRAKEEGEAAREFAATRATGTTDEAPAGSGGEVSGAGGSDTGRRTITVTLTAAHIDRISEAAGRLRGGVSPDDGDGPDENPAPGDDRYWRPADH